MRYAIFGLLFLVSACGRMTPEQRAQWEDTNCAIGTSFGSVGVGDSYRYVSVAEAAQWCRAMRQGTPYVPVRGPAEQTIIRTDDGTKTYVCFDLNGIIKCRER